MLIFNINIYIYIYIYLVDAGRPQCKIIQYDGRLMHARSYNIAEMLVHNEDDAVPAVSNGARLWLWERDAAAFIYMFYFILYFYYY